MHFTPFAMISLSRQVMKTSLPKPFGPRTLSGSAGVLLNALDLSTRSDSSFPSLDLALPFDLGTSPWLDSSLAADCGLLSIKDRLPLRRLSCCAYRGSIECLKIGDKTCCGLQSM